MWCRYAGGAAAGTLPDLSKFRAKIPGVQNKEKPSSSSVGPPPIPKGMAKRSRSGTGPPPIPKGKGKAGRAMWGDKLGPLLRERLARVRDPVGGTVLRSGGPNFGKHVGLPNSCHVLASFRTDRW